MQQPLADVVGESSSVPFDPTMDSTDLSAFLINSGIPREVCDVLEREDIDAESFLELTESELKGLISKLGHVKKILKLQRKLTSSDAVLPDNLQENAHFQPPSSPLSPVSPFSPPAKPFSPSESDDGVSVASSASALHHKFMIPDTWRPSIMACIQQPTDEERKMQLTPKIRNEIVRDLVVSMFSFQQKPNKTFIEQAARLLVKKYPFLKDVGQNVSGYGSWEKKILERIHNVNSGSKKRHLSGELETPKAKRGRPKQDALLIRYPPLRETDDDDVAAARNVQKLHKELMEARSKKEVVLALARETFLTRRESVLADPESVTASELLKEYPELTKGYVIEQEMDLVLSKRDSFKQALQSWKEIWVPTLLEYGSHLHENIYDSAQKMFEGDPEKDEKAGLYILCKVLSKKGAASALAYIYEECKMTDTPEQVATRRPPRSAPRFAGFKGDDSSTALMLCFALFYVLNLEYCKQAKEVCLFIQEFVFSQPVPSVSTRQKSATYLSVTTDIQKFKEE